MRNNHPLIWAAALSLLCAAGGQLRAAELPTTAEKVSAAIRKASPGDTLVIADGVYRDVRLALQAAGDPEHPIVVRARTPGKVIIEGCSDLRIAGSGIVVSGLWFRNGCSPTGSVIEYRQGSRHATGCRVTQCVIDGFNPGSRQTKGNWVQLYGHNNRFDHNTVVGKYNEGVTVAAILNGTDRQHHRIDHNYFGPRPVYARTARRRSAPAIRSRRTRRRSSSSRTTTSTAAAARWRSSR